MKTQLIAIALMTLMLSLPFTLATDIITEDQLYEQDEIGEDIVINVDEYQPRIIRSSLIEEQNVNVYALLKGIPSNPTLSIGNIRTINVRPTKVITEPEGKEVSIGTIKYVRPGVQNNAIRDLFYSTFLGERTPGREEIRRINTQGLGYVPDLDYNNLGYLVVPIQQIEREDDVPESITIQMEGSIEFDATAGLNFGPSTDVLVEQSEAEWQPEKELHRFYGGYLRVDNIDDGRAIAPLGRTVQRGIEYYAGSYYADIVVYDLNGRRINLGSYLAETTLAQDGALGEQGIGIRPGALRLRIGETSRTLTTPTNGQTHNLFNKFRIQLNEIRAQTPHVDLLVQHGDEPPQKVSVGQGSLVSTTSNWRLERIRETTQDGKRVFILTFGHPRIGTQDLIVQESNQRGTGTVTEGTPEESCTPYIQTVSPTSTDETIGSILTTLQGTHNYCKTDSIAALKQLQTEYLRRARDQALALDTSTTYLQKAQLAQELLAQYEEESEIIIPQERTPETGAAYTAIIEYKAFLRSYESLSPQEQQPLQEEYSQTYFHLGILYWRLGDTLGAINMLNTYLEQPTSPNEQNQNYAQLLVSLLERSLSYVSEDITLAEPGEQAIHISFIGLPTSLTQGGGIVRIQVVGTDTVLTLQKGDIVPLGQAQPPEGPYDPLKYQWIVSSIGAGTVTFSCITQHCSTLETPEQPVIQGGGVQLQVADQAANVQPLSRELRILQADGPLEAVISVIPVAERAYSSVNFDLHIPIEQRAVELPLFSSSIDKEINNTRELIEKLDGIIDKVTTIHEFWSKICLTTFGVLWAKNLLSVNEGAARREVNPYWKDKYQEDRLAGRIPQGETFDSYLIRNNANYTKDLELTEDIITRIDRGEHITAAQQALEERSISEESFQNSQGFLQEWYLAREKSKQYPELYLQEFVTQDIELQLLGRNQQIDQFKDSPTPPPEIQNFYAGEGGARDPGAELTPAYWRLHREELIRGWAESEKHRIVGEYVLGDEYVPGTALTDQSITFGDALEHVRQQLGKQELTTTEKARIENTLKGYAQLFPAAIVATNELPRASVWPRENGYIYQNGDREVQLYQDPNNNPENPKLKNQPVKQLGPHLPKTEARQQRPVYYFATDDATTPTTALIVDQESDTTHKPLITQYENGNRCEGLTKDISVDAEHYLHVNYRTGCNIEEIEVRKRIDPNTPLGAGSDQVLGNANELALILGNSNNPQQRALADRIQDVNSCITRSNRVFERSPNTRNSLDQFREPLLAKGITCNDQSYRVSKPAPEPEGAACSDFMDPTDCRILFNACDPVICPASRCDLGGNWEVENVVSTGIIGSVALCSLNFPEVAVPVCITGIRAGLLNIKSVLEGYEQCLITQKNEGQSVGICDRVRNVYICEILWREGVAILNVKGGLLSFAAEKLFGLTSDGGNEYASFSDHFEQSVQGIQYFTQDYAKNVFASYDGGSLDSIGTEICKSAIYGKAPGAGDFFDEIQKPESPPQFFAFFDEAPYTDLTQVPQSIYSVYYHIYAGENEDVRYSVYLRGVAADGGQLSNFKFIANNQPLTAGQSADINKDLTGIAGYNEICIEIATQRYGRIQECGFGKVTTNFAANLQEQYVQSQVKQQINNAAQCESEASRLTSLNYNNGQLSGSASPVRAGVGAVSTGILQTGIVRKCFGVNPNNGYPDRPWQEVGTCGQDEQGRDLGACWIYTPALNRALQQESSRVETTQDLRELLTKLEDEGQVDTDYLDNGQIQEQFQEAEEQRNQAQESCTIEEFAVARQTYQEIIDYSIEAGDSVEARYELATTWKDQYYCEEGRRPAPIPRTTIPDSEPVEPILDSSSEITFPTPTTLALSDSSTVQAYLWIKEGTPSASPATDFKDAKPFTLDSLTLSLEQEKQYTLFIATPSEVTTFTQLSSEPITITPQGPILPDVRVTPGALPSFFYDDLDSFREPIASQQFRIHALPLQTSQKNGGISSRTLRIETNTLTKISFAIPIILEGTVPAPPTYKAISLAAIQADSDPSSYTLRKEQEVRIIISEEEYLTFTYTQKNYQADEAGPLAQPTLKDFTITTPTFIVQTDGVVTRQDNKGDGTPITFSPLPQPEITYTQDLTSTKGIPYRLEYYLTSTQNQADRRARITIISLRPLLPDNSVEDIPDEE